MDIANHKKNGYLSQAFDPYNLAKCIEWVLHVSDYETLCKSAREKVVREFDGKYSCKKIYKVVYGNFK